MVKQEPKINETIVSWKKVTHIINNKSFDMLTL